MSYNDNSLVDYILDNTNIIDEISSVVTLKRTGRNNKGLCPFHSEKTPSFIVSEDTQLYHCFGCGAGGNIITFVKQYKNLDFLDAVEYLAEKYNLDIAPYMHDKNTTNYSNSKRLYEMNRQAGLFFYHQLRQNTSALEYLEKRNLDTQTIKKFGIGYAPDQWNELRNYLKYKGFSYEEISSCGLIIKSEKNDSYYDRFRNRIMFPIIDPKNHIIGFGGRVLDNSVPKYLNSPETSIFNKSKTLYGLHIAKDYCKAHKQLIITEGYMDVIALNNYGYHNAVATLGTAFTEQHAQVLKRYCDEVVICYDSDFAGQKATLKCIDILKNYISKIKVITLGANLDPDDFLKQYGTEVFQKKIDESIDYIMFQIDYISRDFNLNKQDDLRDFLIKGTNLIKKLDNNIDKSYYIDLMSKKYKVEKSVLNSEVLGTAHRQSKTNFSQNSFKSYQNKKKSQDVVSKKTITINKMSHHEKCIQLTNRINYVALTDRSIFHERILPAKENYNFDSFTLKLYEFLEDYYSDHELFKIEDVIDTLHLTTVQKIESIMKNYHSTSDPQVLLDQMFMQLKILDLEIQCTALNEKYNTTKDESIRLDILNIRKNINELKSKKTN